MFEGSSKRDTVLRANKPQLSLILAAGRLSVRGPSHRQWQHHFSSRQRKQHLGLYLIRSTYPWLSYYQKNRHGLPLLQVSGHIATFPAYDHLRASPHIRKPSVGFAITFELTIPLPPAPILTYHELR